jgi:hypothetical protein
MVTSLVTTEGLVVIGQRGMDGNMVLGKKGKASSFMITITHGPSSHHLTING